MLSLTEAAFNPEEYVSLKCKREVKYVSDL